MKQEQYKENKLYDLILEYQRGDMDIFIPIYERFIPLVKKYGRKLNYDGSDSDMIIALIEIINKTPITRSIAMKNEAIIVGYISTAMKNKYIYLSKKRCLINTYEVPFNINIGYDYYYEDLDQKIYVETLLKKLPKKEKDVLVLKYLKGYSDVEIASSLNVSRQAVNKTKNKAMKNIRTYM